MAVCGSFWGEKQILLIFVPFYYFEQKGLFKQILIFHLDLPLYKLVKKNKLSEYFSATFRDASFLTKKRGFQWISSIILQINRKAQFSCIWLTLRRETVLLIFVPFYWFDQKQLFNQIQIFLTICPFINLLRKTTFWVFLCSFPR